MSAKETLTDLVLEFLEAAAHEFLFAWHVYPKDAFGQRVLYDVPIHMSRHPLLCEYIHFMLTGCRTWLLKGELEKLCVILLSKQGRTVETLVIEPGWSADLIEAADSEDNQPLPLVQLEEAFRAGMVALVATSMSNTVEKTDSNDKPHTFRILAQTVEDATNRGTAINDDIASNSWVLADPFWCEDQKKPKEIFPVKAIQTENSPIRLNVYMEKQQPTYSSSDRCGFAPSSTNMARLGLSDSMRSTVSVEDTEPLHTAAHRRPPRRPLAAASSAAAASTDASSELQTQAKAASFVLSNWLRVILGGVFALVLLSTGTNMFNHIWSTNSQAGTQLERLEKTLELLGRDTARLQTSADRFLQSAQEAQVAASTRTAMLQNAAKRDFNEQVKTQIQKHEQVMKDVMQYYAQQEQKVMETRARLLEMNITLPVQIAVRPMPETWQQDEQKLIEAGDVVEQRDANDGLAGAMEGLSFFAEKTLQQDNSDYHRLSVDSISIQMNGQVESNNRQMRVEKATFSFGSFFFYIFVVCATAVYLRNAITDSRKKELLDNKWSWSPVPKALSRWKTLLGSVVVLDDLRKSKIMDDRTSTPEHIEHIEF